MNIRLNDYESVIGSGEIGIYRHRGEDSQCNVFSGCTHVYVVKDAKEAIDLQSKLQDIQMVAVIQGPGVLQAFPIVVDAHNDPNKLVIDYRCMWGGAFIYCSNDIVMQGHRHPIRLMERLES